MCICNNGRNFHGYYRFKKGFYGLVDIFPTIFQEKIDRTLKYSTPAWHGKTGTLSDETKRKTNSVTCGNPLVTRGDRREHEKKLFVVVKKMENAGYRASERKSEFFLNKTK